MRKIQTQNESRISDRELRKLARGLTLDTDFISGDLDRVFTVLYEMGRVEPLLSKDWKELYMRSQSRWPEVSTAIRRLNVMDNLRDMKKFIAELPPEIIDALVIEVARELAQFHQRHELLH